MALSKEDKKDVSGAMGKALANKVESATHDNPVKGRAKFVKGRIELRSEKSPRNVALTKKKREGQREFIGALSKKHPVLQEHVKAGLKLGLLQRKD